jgi:hypothetical protein
LYKFFIAELHKSSKLYFIYAIDEVGRTTLCGFIVFFPSEGIVILITTEEGGAERTRGLAFAGI